MKPRWTDYLNPLAPGWSSTWGATIALLVLCILFVLACAYLFRKIKPTIDCNNEPENPACKEEK
jgi:uncharacterized membrane protein (DUF485 family)